MRNVTLSLRLQSLIGHRIAKRSHALDGYFHFVARHNRPHSGWRATGNQIARIQGHRLRDVADHDIQIKYEVARVAVLLDVTVDLCLYSDTSPRIDLIRNHRADWTKR